MINNKIKSQILLLIIATSAVTSCGGRVKHRYSAAQNNALSLKLDKSLKDIDIRQSDKKSNVIPKVLPNNNYYLDSNSSLPITISKRGYTRFSIEEERITDVFVYPKESLQVRIHDQGYLVVVPNEQVLSDSLMAKFLDQVDLSKVDIAQIERIKSSEEKAKQEIYVTITGEQGTTQDFFLRFAGGRPKPVKFVKHHLDNNLIKKSN